MESFSNAIEPEASGNAPVTESAPTLAAATEKVFKGWGVESWWSSGGAVVEQWGEVGGISFRHRLFSGEKDGHTFRQASV